MAESKHVVFEDQHSSAGDEDERAVEVVFDSSNPYRRKSSLVTSEALPPKLLQSRDKAQCLVHQFLDSQRMATKSSRHHEHSHHPHDHHHHHNDSSDHFPGPRSGSGVNAEEEHGLNRLVEPKGTTRRIRARALDPVASDASDAGQVDEKEWRKKITNGSSDIETDASDSELDSRLLTKKQLSEMAWGVRELSRRLGSMRLKFRVKTIFILTKIYDHELLPKTRELVKWLLSREHDVRYTVWIEKALKTSKRFDVAGLLEEVRQDYVQSGELSEEASKDFHKRLRFWDEALCRTRPHTFDFVVTLGGDGTVLYASWLFQRIVPPVLSFALGSLGFLTKFDFEDYRNTLSKAFRDGVTVSLRLRFEGTIMRSQRKKRAIVAGAETPNGSSDNDEASLQRRRDLVEELIGEEKDDEHTHKPDGTYEILNEIVVDRGPNGTMSQTEIFGDDEHFTSVLADGICVSTPTGSTAYNLAAGGSLCHPENPVMLVTSICAHTLSFRPIILPDTIVLRVGVPYDARTSSWASFDGRERLELKPGDYVTISASRYPFASVQSQGRRSEDWVNSISGKLGWNTRQKQKAYEK
ncbi:ATP NAD kinase [Pleurostoma richardsiae]|uniref:ATP NAD kinase n=1 Tax=Pleurostoma richardsiae TaxID=41990 RepID=A0AA38VUG1_9PEZI|nr:ATP NAD kinase [Pleurostoma richardsiae]